MNEDELKDLNNKLVEYDRLIRQLEDKILINRVAIILSHYTFDVLNFNEPDTKLIAERIVRLIREFIC